MPDSELSHPVRPEHSCVAAKSAEYVFQLSIACLAGRYEEALAPGKSFPALNPYSWLGHFNLAVIYSELGQAAEARAEVAEVLRLNPNFSLEVHKQRTPIKDPAALERHIAALRKAGLK